MPLDIYDGAGDQPHRWRVTNDNPVKPEILADSGEGYTEERGAIEGAGHVLEQLLRHHPDAPTIASEWISDLGDEDRELIIPEHTIVVLGRNVDPDDAETITAAFMRWFEETGNPGTVRR